MSRVPGNPDAKRAFLSTLDQTTLPHLVGDVLAFLYKHREVRIVDGPGDGKRDIHSLRPDKARHITQCKYHKNTSATVSSDETDELILALSKFGCKSGLFVTTGKLSPQAKREYLDNYPSFDLKFMDGLDLADAVLSSPILSAVWFNGKSIVQVRSSLQVSFVIRAMRDDRAITEQAFSETVSDGISYQFGVGTSHKLNFEPYRPPTIKDGRDYDADRVRCYNVQCSGSINIHNIPEQYNPITRAVAEQISEEYLPVIIRLGVPSLAANIQTEQSDLVTLSQIRPESFVITKGRTVVAEKDWIVIGQHDDWVFPKNLSVSEADWAGWLSRSRNTIFMQELAWPAFGQPSYFTEMKHGLLKQWLEQSLFVGGIKEDCDAFLDSLPENDRPNWSCPYGPSGVLLGWLQPMLQAYESQTLTFRHSGKEGKFETLPETDLQLDVFQTLLERIRALIINSLLAEVEFEQARYIAAAAGDDLLPAPEDAGDIRPAELVHYYSDIPSPVYLQDRKFLFVRMWQIKSPLAEVRQLLEDSHISLEGGAWVFWDARLGRKTQKTFILSTLAFLCPPDVSADDYFEFIHAQRDENLKRLADLIYSFGKEAELATEFFWRTEVGFQIDEKGFRGTPWMILQSEDGTSQIVYLNDGSKESG